MNINDYVINDIKPFDVQSSIKDIQMVFNQLTYSHVPVIKNGVYVGCINETDAYCFEGKNSLENYQYNLEPFFVRINTNWLDVLEAFAQFNSNIMPVLDEQNKYLGYYELNDVMTLFNDTPFLSELGGIIIVEKGIRDYSFSEICQIVESNDTQILGVFISKFENDTMQATIKIGQAGINAIVQTFRRYGYTVISQNDEDSLIEDLKKRSDYLNKYLNM